MHWQKLGLISAAVLGLIAVPFKLLWMCVLMCLLPPLSLSPLIWVPEKAEHGHLPWCPCGHSLTVRRGDLTIRTGEEGGSSTGAGRGPFLLQHPCFWTLVFFHSIIPQRPTDEIDETDAEFTGPRLAGDGWSGCCFQPGFYSEARRAIFCHQELISNTRQPSPTSQELQNPCFILRGLETPSEKSRGLTLLFLLESTAWEARSWNHHPSS